MDTGEQKIIQENILNKIPLQVKNVMETLAEAGYKSYLVGGAVRDILMGVEPKDWDVATDAHWTETIKLFQKVKIVSEELSVLKILPEHEEISAINVSTGSNYNRKSRETKVVREIDVATLRRESYIKTVGKPDLIEFTKDIHEDLPRRDFTINAMAIDLEGNLIDDFGGKRDAEKKILRFVGNGKKRITEDPVRMLRGIRMIAEKGMVVTDETLAAFIEKARLIRFVSGERIGTELKGIAKGRFREYGFNDLLETGLFNEIFSVEICGILAFCAAVELGREPMKYVELDVAADLEKLVQWSECDFEIWQVVMGYFLIKTMKVAKVRKEIFKREIEKLSMEKTLTEGIVSAYENIDKIVDIRGEEEKVSYDIKKMVNKLGEKNYRYLETILIIGLWDGVDGFRLGSVKWQDLDVGQVNNDSLDRLKFFEKLINNNEAVYVKDLAVTGKDLQEELGIQGREIGELLEYLLDIVQKKPQLNYREELLAQAKRKQESYGGKG